MGHMFSLISLFAFMAALAGLAGCGSMTLCGAGAAPQPPGASHTYLLHMPGMAGWVQPDTDWLRGMEEGGAFDRIEVYDWPPPYFLIGAVQAYEHNRVAARWLADSIAAKVREDPAARIILSGWSAGAAITIWALEDLPDDVQVQSVLLIQAAVDPDHDLTRALRHVRGHLFSLQSGADLVVLGLGTLIVGTADGGAHTASAGQTGFHKPPGCNPEDYAKLVDLPYKLDWIVYGDLGGHVGQMSPALAKNVLAPMLAGDGENSQQITLSAPPAR